MSSEREQTVLSWVMPAERSTELKTQPGGIGDDCSVIG
jgi:hypothetical protein